MSEDATAGALQNELVLRHIFEYLPTSSLLSCSCVNQLWRNEARLFIRDNRECTIKVGYGCNLWKNLFQLDKVLGGMTTIPFNSLRIVVTNQNVDCDEETDMKALTNLMKRFPLKFLSIFEQGQIELSELSVCSSPVASTVLELISENSSTLLELEIRSGLINNGLFNDWEPPERFEKLQKLSIAQTSSVSSDCAKKIIHGAPNLRVIHNNCLHMIRNNAIPENMYRSLKRLALTIEDVHRVEKLPGKLDHLEELLLDVEIGENSDRLVGLFQKVLALNALNLCDLDIRCEDGHLFSQLELPTLPSLKNLSISVYNLSESLVDITSLNFRRTFPNLRKVHILENCPFPFEYDNNGHIILDDQDIIPAPNASETAVELVIDATTSMFDLVTLRGFFPNVMKFSIDRPECVPLLGLAGILWPNLQFLSIRARPFEDEALDAQVFGLHPEELEFLRRQDNEFLELVQVAPIRPCVWTMQKLKHLKVEYGQEKSGTCTFRKLVKTLLMGRMSNLKFRMDRIDDRHRCWTRPRFKDLRDEFRFDLIHFESSEGLADSTEHLNPSS